ncbi:MAG: holo-ACP synthase [Deltaproteobacteria bacterium]|nr:holo-ACP synthase [Deltaproteobacteria bacterium]
MIVGYGIDAVEIARIRRQVAGGRAAERSARFLARCFTDAERAYCDARNDRATHYAARFAAKEAAMKALGAPAGIRFTDVEVLREEGPPRLRLGGAAARAAEALGVTRMHLSLTHDGGMAVAGVILERGEP